MKLDFKVFLLILVLMLTIGFILTGFTHNIQCPTCNCTGKEWGMWYDFNAGTWVQGYHTCYTCGGSGKIWVHSIQLERNSWGEGGKGNAVLV